MTDILSKKIDSLPPLPKTLLDLEEFKKLTNKDLEVLEEIISQDPLKIKIHMHSPAFPLYSKASPDK